MPKHHAVQVQTGHECNTSHTLHQSTRQKLVVSFTLRSLCLRRNISWYPLNRRLETPYNQSGGECSASCSGYLNHQGVVLSGKLGWHKNPRTYIFIIYIILLTELSWLLMTSLHRTQLSTPIFHKQKPYQHILLFADKTWFICISTYLHHIKEHVLG